MLPLLDNLDKLEPFLSAGRPALMTAINGAIRHMGEEDMEDTITDRCRRLLEQLTARLSLVAVMTGGTAERAREMVGVDGIVYIGNHGLERWSSEGTMYWGGVQMYTESIPGVLASLQARLNLDGITYEDNGISASICYRNAQNTQLARNKIVEALSGAQKQGLTVREGPMFVELRPDVPMNERLAVMSLMEEHNINAGVCLGDGITDVDSFNGMRRWALERRRFGATIAVLSRDAPEALKGGAHYYLNGVDAVEDFLGWLVQNVKN